MNTEEQFKNIEKNIAQAVNSSEYPFTEEAWKRMELLLDKKDKKRRPLFWIWSFVLCGFFIGGYFVYKNSFRNQISHVSNKPSSISLKKGNTAQTSSLGENLLVTEKEKEQQNNQQKKIFNGETLVEKNTTHTNSLVDTKSVLKPNRNIKNGTVGDSLFHQNQNTKVDDKVAFGKKRKFTKKAKAKIKITSPGVEDGIEDEEGTEEKIDVASPQLTTITKELIPKTEEKKNKARWNDELKVDISHKNTNTNADEKKKEKKKFSSNLFIIANIGLEANTTKFLSLKNITLTPRYGVGLGYQVSNKLSIQTGLYASAKKYIAGPNDYTIKAGSPLLGVEIIMVDANCLTYEIPLSLQYNLVQNQSLNLYVSIGTSTYIMKKEKYDYTFSVANTIYQYPYDYTGNKHLFATFNFSFGVEKKINPNLFIQAAPNFIIPLGGVGEGSIKLFTTSLNLGVKYFPFKKNK